MPPRRQAVAGGRGQPASGAQPAYDELLHFFNESPDLLCIAGFDGKFKRLNPAWPRALGWTIQRLQARPFLDFVHPDDRPATLAEMEKLSAGASTISFENRYQCKDSSWKWLQWTASPLPGRDEIYAIARDVTGQKRLEMEILRISEQEQQRIGRDLHDSLGPHLAAIRFAATFLANDLRQHGRPEAPAAERIRDLVTEAVALMRALARGIFPGPMGGPGLAVALEELARTTSSQTGRPVSFYQTGNSPVEDPEQGLHFYRIVQEALNNSLKHAGARKITIILNNSAGALRVAVADDGQGMGPSPNGAAGMGLRSMQYRARALGGELTIESKRGEGTIVSCEIPHRPPPPATRAS